MRDKGKEKERSKRHVKVDISNDRSKDKKCSRDKERRHTRSRSRSRETVTPRKPIKLSYREERQKHKLAQLEKLGIDIKIPEEDQQLNKEQTFYNPLTTSTQGKYAEQIKKRRMLWANKVRSHA